jgi:hypothetical protein
LAVESAIAVIWLIKNFKIAIALTVESAIADLVGWVEVTKPNIVFISTRSVIALFVLQSVVRLKGFW